MPATRRARLIVSLSIVAAGLPAAAACNGIVGIQDLPGPRADAAPTADAGVDAHDAQPDSTTSLDSGRDATVSDTGRTTDTGASSEAAGDTGSTPDMTVADAVTDSNSLEGGDADATTPPPPSCADSDGGPGLDDCRQESCCTSRTVAGNSTGSMRMYYRTFDFLSDGGVGAGPDGSAINLADPAQVSSFRLDKYEVTVGRFRRFVQAVYPNGPDAGVGWAPTFGSGKHVHLNNMNGLANSATGAYEPGWDGSSADLAPTDANLLSCPPFSTWTTTPSTYESLPINCVTWWEAYAFCIWDGGFLPSELEREYAAADGPNMSLYPWGNTDPGTGSAYAIYACNYPNPGAGCAGSSALNIAVVGSASAGVGLYGQFDLSGNVWDWTLDAYADYSMTCRDCAYLPPESDAATFHRVVRGGSFYDSQATLVTSSRAYTVPPAAREGNVGFRCARGP